MARRSSIRQIKTMQLVAQGMSKRQAMIQAGYSINSANQAKRIMTTETMTALMDNFKDKFVDAGLTTEYWVSKIKDWAESENIKDQVNAFDRWYQIMGESIKDNKSGVPKRKITLEEWIAEPDYKQVNSNN